MPSINKYISSGVETLSIAVLRALIRGNNPEESTEDSGSA